MLGTCTKASSPNITYCTVYYTNRTRYYNVNNETGVITLVSNINPSQAFDYEAYSYAGTANRRIIL